MRGGAFGEVGKYIVKAGAALTCLPASSPRERGEESLHYEPHSSLTGHGAFDSA